ncbi:MAG: hypothetical protein ABSE51_02185 [Terracidiphilus sp.]
MHDYLGVQAIGGLTLVGIASDRIAVIQVHVSVRFEFDCTATVHNQIQPAVVSALVVVALALAVVLPLPSRSPSLWSSCRPNWHGVHKRDKDSADTKDGYTADVFCELDKSEKSGNKARASILIRRGLNQPHAPV